MKYTAKQEMQLITELHDPAIKDDLHKFVLFSYPWGKAGTPLERFKGPRKWQIDVLNAITAHIAEQRKRGLLDIDPEIFRMTVASGRGIGKSALVSWICHWHMTTRIGSTSIVSANTKPQLEAKTFPEIRKWFSLAINAHWFELLATAIRPDKWFGEVVSKQLGIDPQYYYVQAALWSEENPDAYAGAHSHVGMLLIFDEASGIPKSIWHVARGFFTDLHPNRYWLAFSNPRNNSGGFFDTFHDPGESPFWRTRQIDARTVEDCDKSEFEKTIKAYGIDHDMVRVEVLGQFPKAGADQFISNSSVAAAQTRVVDPDPGAPLIMGVDVARYGDDKTVVRFRQGPDARSIPPVTWGHCDLYTTADRVAALITEWKPDAVCVDHGMGAGVIDILKRKRYHVHEVHFGSSPDSDEWADKRTEMYGRAREWLQGGMLDDDRELFGDLTAAGYTINEKNGKIRLEPKDSFKSKLGRSPDQGDAFALTFAVKAARRDYRASRHANRARQAADTDYALFGG